MFSLSKRGFSRRNARKHHAQRSHGNGERRNESAWLLPISPFLKVKFHPMGSSHFQVASSSPSRSKSFALQCGVPTMPRNEGQLSTNRFKNHPLIGSSHPALQRQQQWVVWNTGKCLQKERQLKRVEKHKVYVDKNLIFLLDST